MKVYARLEGKLAEWDVDTLDIMLAINQVRRHALPKGFQGAVLAVVPKPVQLELWD